MLGFRSIQFESEHTQVELTDWHLTGKVADEDIIFLDQIDAEPAEAAEPLSAV